VRVRAKPLDKGFWEKKDFCISGFLAHVLGGPGEANLSEGLLLGDVKPILDRLATGTATEQAVREVLHDDYADLMQATAEYLKKIT
jgi:hypothetical protein